MWKSQTYYQREAHSRNGCCLTPRLRHKIFVTCAGAVFVVVCLLVFLQAAWLDAYDIEDNEKPHYVTVPEFVCFSFSLTVFYQQKAVLYSVLLPVLTDEVDHNENLQTELEDIMEWIQ